MDISKKHIKDERRIGTLKGKPVIQIETTGGFWMIVHQKSEGVETLGTGPHRAIARYIAKKRAPDLQITELSKSEDLDVEQFIAIVPKYERMTDECNALFQ